MSSTHTFSTSLQRATSGYSALISSRVNKRIKYTLPAFTYLTNNQRRWKASAVSPHPQPVPYYSPPPTRKQKIPPPSIPNQNIPSPSTPSISKNVQAATYDDSFVGLTGGQIFHELMLRHGVKHVFGYPGGAILPVFDAIYNSTHFDFILPRHEQGAGHMAEGYARASGKPGVILVTSGPGATNVVTPMQDALLDGTPLIVFCGQVPVSAIGTDAFQEADVVGISRACTKWNVMVKDIAELPRRITEAFEIATTGRPGPVLVDLPKDVTASVLTKPIPTQYTIPFRAFNESPALASSLTNTPNIRRAAEMINKAKRPIIYAGQGVLSTSEGPTRLRELASLGNIPVTTTLQGLGAFDELDSRSLHMLGMHGSAYANLAMQNADTIIALGARFDDRVTGRLSHFAPKAKQAAAENRGGIIHFEISPKNINKVIQATTAVEGDVSDNLNRLLPLIESSERKEWFSEIDEWKRRYPWKYTKPSSPDQVLKPQQVIEELDKQTTDYKEKVLITTGVGQHQMWAAQFFRWRHPRTMITSGGLGTMGYGLPSAIGAKVASPDKIVIDIDGDASFCMTGMELATASQYNIGVKVLILNNDFQGMVKQWQDLFYEERYSQTRMVNPDFVKLSESMGVKALRIRTEEELPSKMKEFLEYNDGPNSFSPLPQKVRKEGGNNFHFPKKKKNPLIFFSILIMAASVDNRQFRNLNGVVHTFNPSNNFIHDLKPGFPVNKDLFSSDDEEENDDASNLQELIRKTNAEVEPSILDPRDEGTLDNWVTRNATMVRLTGKHPFNSEPPLPRLMHHGFITPVPIHYVRNHGAVPKARWEDWTVEVSGLVKNPTRFTMDRLVREFPSRELPVTLVCAGNRRKEQNMVKQSVGFNWGAAAVSNSVWRGVSLRHVLKRCGIITRSKGAVHVCFYGAEDLPGGGGSKYGTSIRREIAMDPSRDVILAYMQNGEALAPDHGFPVRVIIPGFIGGRMVKWLKRIVVTTDECDGHYHYKDNRVLPSHVDAEQANEEGWWYKPEYIINELNINSVITTPCHDEILPINSWTTQRPYTLKGYSYSGGGRKVTRVEVTMDGGETWHVCTLDHPEKPTKYGKYWCWCFWSLEVEVLDLLGTKEIAVRAWDEALNTQPENLIWNVMGMMNNCWFRVKTNVCRPHKGEIGIVFEHPTQPGNQSGGWMAKERHLERSQETKPILKKSISTPFMNTSSKTYSLSEVKKHKTLDSAWIIVHGNVYDCTRFLKDHPGGSDSILINAGTDCTDEFEAIHSDKAKKLLEDYRIGELVATGYTSDSSSPNNSMHGNSEFTHLAPIKEIMALNPREKIPCKLIAKTSISHDVRLFRFALPSEDQLLGLPVGKHIFLCVTVDGKLVMRAYTPTSSVDEIGYFELVVKVYFKNVHPRFPNGGIMSQYLDSLTIGSTLEVKGPVGHIEYLGRGNFSVHGKQRFAKKLTFLAGGTGITPVYQVANSILKDANDQTEMYVVYANRTEDDILLREELDEWAKIYSDRFKIWYVVENAKEGWEYSVGFITESIMREHVPLAGEDTLALACGPPPMIQFAVQPNLEKMGYDIKKDLLVF